MVLYIKLRAETVSYLSSIKVATAIASALKNSNTIVAFEDKKKFKIRFIDKIILI